MWNVLKKPFLKSLSISDEVLSKFGIRGTPEYQRVTSKGSRTMGSEWPDKCDKTGFGNVARGAWCWWGADESFVFSLQFHCNLCMYKIWWLCFKLYGKQGWHILKWKQPTFDIIKITDVLLPKYSSFGNRMVKNTAQKTSTSPTVCVTNLPYLLPFWG